VQAQRGSDLAQLHAEVELLTQQVKLKDLVIASYIPRGQQRRIMQASAWDAVQQCWRIAFADVGDGPTDAPRYFHDGTFCRKLLHHCTFDHLNTLLHNPLKIFNLAIKI
jgi:hypothetical protein